MSLLAVDLKNTKIHSLHAARNTCASTGVRSPQLDSYIFCACFCVWNTVRVSDKFSQNFQTASKAVWCFVEMCIRIYSAGFDLVACVNLRRNTWRPAGVAVAPPSGREKLPSRMYRFPLCITYLSLHSRTFPQGPSHLWQRILNIRTKSDSHSTVCLSYLQSHSYCLLQFSSTVTCQQPVDSELGRIQAWVGGGALLQDHWKNETTPAPCLCCATGTISPLLPLANQSPFGHERGRPTD